MAKSQEKKAPKPGAKPGAKPGRKDGRKPGLRALSATVPKLTDRALRRRGFVEAAVIHRWSAIVGEEIASWCSPDRILFPRDRQLGATLHLSVAGARALEVQHLEPVLLERVNMVFGYRAIERIAIRQTGTLKAPPSPPPAPRALGADEKAWVAQQLEGLHDPGLKAALAALGGAVLARRPPRPQD